MTLLIISLSIIGAFVLTVILGQFVSQPSTVNCHRIIAINAIHAAVGNKMIDIIDEIVKIVATFALDMIMRTNKRDRIIQTFVIFKTVMMIANIIDVKKRAIATIDAIAIIAEE